MEAGGRRKSKNIYASWEECVGHEEKIGLNGLHCLLLSREGYLLYPEFKDTTNKTVLLLTCLCLAFFVITVSFCVGLLELW